MFINIEIIPILMEKIQDTYMLMDVPGGHSPHGNLQFL